MRKHRVFSLTLCSHREHLDVVETCSFHQKQPLVCSFLPSTQDGRAQTGAKPAPGKATQPNGKDLHRVPDTHIHPACKNQEEGTNFPIA